MPSPPSPSADDKSPRLSQQDDLEYYEGVELGEIWRRIARGFVPTLGLLVLGSAIAMAVYLAASPVLPISTSTRVVFTFDGYNRGEYPDHSKFTPDDLRAPDIVFDAIDRLGLNAAKDFQARIQAGLTIEGIIPPDVLKERDHLRIVGQSQAPYIPDEYSLVLSLPAKYPLSDRQRELLLSEIVSVYRDKFQRTYGNVPLGFGNAFEELRGDDFFEYELVLNQEIANIEAYLDTKIENAKSFRSQTTNLTFFDLRKQVELFAQVRLNEALGQILVNGLSRDRELELVKMKYYLQTLQDDERKAAAEGRVVEDLLAKAQDRAQGYVLGIKSQVAQERPEAPVLDQGLIDSLLANDSYSFLVHQALDAGIKVKDIQAAEEQLAERQKILASFEGRSAVDQTDLIARVEKSLASLEVTYNRLIANIRNTNSDYAQQEFGNAVRITAQPQTEWFFKKLAIAGAVGAFLGLMSGLGLSLLGVNFGSGTPALRMEPRSSKA